MWRNKILGQWSDLLKVRARSQIFKAGRVLGGEEAGQGWLMGGTRAPIVSFTPTADMGNRSQNSLLRSWPSRWNPFAVSGPVSCLTSLMRKLSPEQRRDLAKMAQWVSGPEPESHPCLLSPGFSPAHHAVPHLLGVQVPWKMHQQGMGMTFFVTEPDHLGFLCWASGHIPISKRGIKDHPKVSKPEHLAGWKRGLRDGKIRSLVLDQLHVRVVKTTGYWSAQFRRGGVAGGINLGVMNTEVALKPWD